MAKKPAPKKAAPKKAAVKKVPAKKAPAKAKEEKEKDPLFIERSRKGADAQEARRGAFIKAFGELGVSVKEFTRIAAGLTCETSAVPTQEHTKFAEKLREPKVDRGFNKAGRKTGPRAPTKADLVLVQLLVALKGRGIEPDQIKFDKKGNLFISDK